MSRRKAAAIEAPATRESAAALAGRYAALEHFKEQRRARFAARIAEIEAERDAELAAMETEALAIVARLKAWWAVQGRTLLAPKAKSLRLAGVQIGTRTGNPALKLPKGLKQEAVISTLKASGKSVFVRLKEELNKPLMIAALRWAEPDGAPANDAEAEARFMSLSHRLALEGMGLSVGQKEEFFVEVDGAEPPKTMEDDA